MHWQAATPKDLEDHGLQLKWMITEFFPYSQDEDIVEEFGVSLSVYEQETS